MHSLRVPYFFFTNNTGDPQGDTLGLIYPFSNKSCICIFSSISLGVLILYGALDIGVEQARDQLRSQYLFLEVEPGISSGKTSLNSWIFG
jgi:hypothetical protein